MRGEPVRAVIESMTGARFIHDQLELAGWDVRIADAYRAKGIAKLACKTDRSDARTLAQLAALDLVPEIWLPDPGVREERELARFRIHLVKQRTMLKNRIHQTLLTHGIACPVSDLFGVRGRQLLERSAMPPAWRESTDACLRLIADLDREIDRCASEMRAQQLDHRYLPLLMTVPGIGPILGYTIAAEIGDIHRFATPRKLVGYTGLCPRVHQTGERDHRRSLSKRGPETLRWALIEAAQHAARSAVYRDCYQAAAQAGRHRGAKVAQIDVARKLTEAIWHMLTNQPALRSRLREAPLFVWPPDGPSGLGALGAGLQCRLVLPPRRQ